MGPLKSMNMTERRVCVWVGVGWGAAHHSTLGPITHQAARQPQTGTANVCLNGDSHTVHRKFNLFHKPGMKKQLFTVPSFHDLFL